VLEIRALRKIYDGPGRQVQALRDITFSVRAGEFACVVGPPGCAASGQITPVKGKGLNKSQRAELARESLAALRRTARPRLR
jgi:NitT/TauT family transport system ATP-binding protein